MLTALRTNEVLGAAPAEIDRISRTHVVRPKRMKAGREHRVPLSAEALAVLDAAEARRTGPMLFSGGRGARMSDTTLLINCASCIRTGDRRRTGCAAASATGARSMPWTRELAERQLAHRVQDATEAAYLRTDALDPRRALAKRWTHFLITPAEAGGDVADIEAERRARAGSSSPAVAERRSWLDWPAPATRGTQAGHDARPGVQGCGRQCWCRAPTLRPFGTWSGASLKHRGRWPPARSGYGDEKAAAPRD